MLYLDNFARASEFEKVYQEKYMAVKNEATMNFWFSFLLVLAGSVIVGVFYAYFVQSRGWILLIPLLAIVLGLYNMIYTTNVITTASILMSEAKIDKGYLNKYIFYRKQTDQLRIY